MRIAIIAAQNSLSRIREIDPVISHLCEPQYLPYADLEEMLSLCRVAQADGILFSGLLPYNTAQDALGPFPQPTAYLDVSQRDFYKALTRIALNNRGMDFSRVLIDATNKSFDLGGIFPPGKGPLYGPESDVRGSDIYQDYLSAYRNAWQSGRIDLVVTRLTSLSSALEREHIRHEILFPSKTSMIDTFRRLVREVEAQQMADSLSAFILVSPSEPGGMKGVLLYKALMDFGREQGASFVIRQSQERFDVVTSSGVARRLTRGYTFCPLEEYLREQLDFPVNIGWGIGADVLSARRNAARALGESQHSGGRGSFLVTQENQVIGPLGEENAIAYTGSPNHKAEVLSRLLSMSPLAVQKILSVLEKLGRDQLTSQELAEYLGITQRSASRLLGQITQRGGAQEVLSDGPSRRGRPQKRYQITFDALLAGAEEGAGHRE
ncbi:hypothetical protein [Merdimmobilis hominis]|uniref:hypothetical protein n=1 Tax=Merdimmobilis hominis TaxID=2897707 RepID=UPI0008F81DE8|nr:hypothetical protein [Merdimmobilis hominis]PWL62341.1 MAG: hypothetical protein DBY34_03250 [Oscillospiraceae bacterium]